MKNVISFLLGATLMALAVWMQYKAREERESPLRAEQERIGDSIHFIDSCKARWYDEGEKKLARLDSSIKATINHKKQIQK